MRGPVVLLAVAVLGAGCAGDDDEDATTATSAEATAAGDDDATVISADATAGDEDATVISADATAAGDEFCPAVRRYVETVELSPVFTSADPPGRDVLEDALDDLGSQLDALEATAPADVAVDVGLIARGTRDFIAAIEDHDYDFGALAADPAFAELTAELEGEAFVQAAQHLRTYAEQTCRITDITAPSGT